MGWYVAKLLPDGSDRASTRRLTIGAGAETWFDAVLLSLRDPAVDLASVNLLQNGNCGP